MMYRRHEDQSTLTAVYHNAKLFQEEVDVSVIFHFSSFSEHHQNRSTSVQILLQDLQLKHSRHTDD